jgi:Lon-like ATP-dependent protease
MSHSFLIHVSKTIPRSKVNQAIWSQLQSPVASKPLNLRSFSTSRSQSNVSIWGGGSVLQQAKNNPQQSLCIGLEPIRSAAGLRRAASSYSAIEMKDQDPKDIPPPSDQAPPPAGGNAAGGESGNSNNSGGDGKSGKNHSWDVVDNQLQKPTVPEVYPQVLALPIAGRPLFPGFYKAVVIKEPTVTAAIKELMKRGQPYVGAFLLKDEGLDVDTITNIDQVHQVGVFAQITSVFPATSGKEESGLTAVLYPHRRIKINELLPIKEKHTMAAVEEVASKKESLAVEGEKAVEKPSKAIESEFEPERAIVQKSGNFVWDQFSLESIH